MATEAMIGYQSVYRIHDGLDPGELINITPGEATADRVEVTHMNSPDRRREYISGMIDSGEASFEINWSPGNATDLLIRELFTSGDVRTHQIEFPNGVTVDYDATIIGFSKAVPIDDRMTATVTVAVSGAETWTAAA